MNIDVRFEEKYYNVDVRFSEVKNIEELKEPEIFHLIEDGRLMILGALSAMSFPDGLYIDCMPS